MTEQTVTGPDVTLTFERFGAPTDPTVLLIAGGAQSMVWWPDTFCRRVAAGGRQVVRYDHRDTGRSTSWPAGHPGYTGTALATDPLLVLDALSVTAAHVVGLSMGGGIAQYLGVEHPGRVRSLTLMFTSPAGGRSDGGALPPVDPALAATFSDPIPEPDWEDRAAVIRHRVEVERPYAGDVFEADRLRRLATLEVDRTADMAASMTNHVLAESSWSGRGRLGAITAPTLVVHGTADPLFPIGHGRALVAEIPGARLLALDGVGHEVPPPRTWDGVIPELLAHTAG